MSFGFRTNPKSSTLPRPVSDHPVPPLPQVMPKPDHPDPPTKGPAPEPPRRADEQNRERQRGPQRRTKQLDGYVGFANLPNQVYRRAVKKGFHFTLMVVGEWTGWREVGAFGERW